MSCTRRTFLTAASGLALSSRLAASTVQGANDRIRIGVIGTGGRARGLMNLLKKLPGSALTAVCDVYEPRMLQAAEIAGGPVKVTDYRRILEDREIDAVVIGTPDHWHKAITLDAVAAGKDVYVEKPVSHTIEEGAEMVKVIEASKQIVQTGTQQRSWDHWVLGKQIVDSGRLGRSLSSRPTGTSMRPPAATNQWRCKSWTGSAGWGRRAISHSGRSGFISGGTSGISAEVA
jgi:predicted dehydrogenase